MNECLKAKSDSLTKLRATQKMSLDDRKVSITSDGKVCKVGPYSVTCDGDGSSDFYMTAPNEDGLIGLYAMDGTTKKGCSGGEGFMCTSSTDSSKEFQIVNDQVVYRGEDSDPPVGPKVCGYTPGLEAVYCPSQTGKALVIKNTIT
jgi:hypothetical protein